MLIDDLARDAADLLSVGNSGQMRSLNRLTELAVREVNGCCGATAMLWHDRELVGLTSTHPDLADLAEHQLRAGAGPSIQALRERQPVAVRDTLRDPRWADWMTEALCRGVRSQLALVHEIPPLTVVLSITSVRAGGVRERAGAVRRNAGRVRRRRTGQRLGLRRRAARGGPVAQRGREPGRGRPGQGHPHARPGLLGGRSPGTHAPGIPDSARQGDRRGPEHRRDPGRPRA